MKRFTVSVMTLMAAIAINATTHIVRVLDKRCQTITGFGAACCDGAMKPFGSDTQPVRLLYGPNSKVGLNIMRMEISPSFQGEGWGDYNWHGSLPSAQLVKQRGGIVFGTPWSPPGSYKTNGTAQGGKVNDQDENDPKNKRGALREDCYEKFFPWLNTFLKYMKMNGVKVDAVSIQNEPDWWVNYSGCLYTPEQQVTLVKNYANKLDRETYKGVRLISAEPLGFDVKYAKALMNDPVAREQIDIIAGHLYGNPPLGGGYFNTPPHMKNSAALAAKYGKEVWMTEHSVTDNIDHLPNWSEQLEFARELNECMLAGCTGYIYWYMRAHWAFVGTGEPVEINKQKITIPGNTKNKLLPRAYVYSHFAKHVTGSTRLDTKATFTTSTNSELETSAFIKGDSIIIMAINSGKSDHKLRMEMPAGTYVKSGTHLISTGNETDKLCQTKDLDITESVTEYTASMPANSLNTYIFMIDQEATAIKDLHKPANPLAKTYYDLQGRLLKNPKGLCIEQRADGFTRKVYIE